MANPKVATTPSLSVEEKVINLLDKKTYQTHRNFINILFKNKQRFLIDGHPNVIKIIATLKSNGLFNIVYNKPTTVTLTFSLPIAENLLLSIKSIKDSLNGLGYRFLVIDKAEYTSPHNFKWIVSLSTDVGVDPILFNKELQRRGMHVVNIFRNAQNKWSYQLNVDKVRIMSPSSLKVAQSVTIKQKKNELFLKIPEEVSDGFSYINITSKEGNSWYPYIVFYDESLSILHMFKNDDLNTNIKMLIPPNTYYIKLDDIYIPQNMSNGFEVILTHQ